MEPRQVSPHLGTPRKWVRLTVRAGVNSRQRRVCEAYPGRPTLVYIPLLQHARVSMIQRLQFYENKKRAASPRTEMLEIMAGQYSARSPR